MSRQKRLYLPYFIYRKVFVLNCGGAAVGNKLLTQKNNIHKLPRLFAASHKQVWLPAKSGVWLDLLHVGKGGGDNKAVSGGGANTWPASRNLGDDRDASVAFVTSQRADFWSVFTCAQLEEVGLFSFAGE